MYICVYIYIYGHVCRYACTNEIWVIETIYVYLYLYAYVYIHTYIYRGRHRNKLMYVNVYGTTVALQCACRCLHGRDY